MSLSNIVKRLQDIMREDDGINGDAQRIEQIVWILFLKIYDSKESEWELLEENYRTTLPENLRWRSWAVDHKDGQALTGDELLHFVNNELFPSLKNLELAYNAPLRQKILRVAFEDNNNYMKNGVLLRKVINVIDEINFDDYKERHAFGEIYESILKDLQSAGKSGEFYTPRALTDFIAQITAPKIGEKIADFACGTGGFLTSTLKQLEPQIKSTDNKDAYNNAIYGIEKKNLPFLLCVTNMLLHDVEDPRILHDNALNTDVCDSSLEKFDVILMNPPFGGNELKSIKQNFPAELRSSETADLFMSVILYRLKESGRAVVILPDGFLFGTDNAKCAIKKKLLKECNLHTVIRLPHSIFAPYTSITTNILFFDKNKNGTQETWFYRLDMPDGYKNFSKTKPMKLEHFAPLLEWWNNREEIIIDELPKAQKFTHAELEERNYNLDLCGFPYQEEEILPPDELIAQYQAKRADLTTDIERILAEIKSHLPQNLEQE